MPIKGEVKVGDDVYTYGEMSFGTNRGITMAQKGVANSKLEYTISPNPHNADSKWYNKNQVAWYKEAAERVAEVANGGPPPPPPVAISVHNTDYTLNAR